MSKAQQVIKVQVVNPAFQLLVAVMLTLTAVAAVILYWKAFLVLTLGLLLCNAPAIIRWVRRTRKARS